MGRKEIKLRGIIRKSWKIISFNGMAMLLNKEQ